MWFASILTSGAASFGRLLIVNLLPSAVPIMFFWILLRANSFSGQSNWANLTPTKLSADTISLVFLLFLVVVISLVVQPFQIRVVRFLEGYWEGWSVTSRLAPVFVEYQRRKLAYLRDSLGELEKVTKKEVDSQAGLGEQARQAKRRVRDLAKLRRIESRIRRYPGFMMTEDESKQIPLLPTALGNALRTAETSAGERYYLSTIYSWPRLYPHFSDKFAAVYASARDAVDAAANICISFFVVTILAAIALLDEPKVYWLPILSTALCGISYVGAVAAAAQHITFMRVAYDLHRFDMLKALHYKLPKDPQEEKQLFIELNEFFEQEEEQYNRDSFGLAADWLSGKYDHGQQKADEARRIGSG